MTKPRYVATSNNTNRVHVRVLVVSPHRVMSIWPLFCAFLDSLRGCFFFALSHLCTLVVSPHESVKGKTSESTIVQFVQKPLLLPCYKLVLFHSLHKYENSTFPHFPSHRFMSIWPLFCPFLDSLRGCFSLRFLTFAHLLCRHRTKTSTPQALLVARPQHGVAGAVRLRNADRPRPLSLEAVLEEGVVAAKTTMMMTLTMQAAKFRPSQVCQKS